MRRSEVWLLNLDPTIGDEIRKTRPVTIVGDDSIGFLSLEIVVPFTDWKDRYENVVWMIKVAPDAENGLSKNSAADVFQIRSVSRARFVRKLGELSSAKMQDIEDALIVVLKIPI